MNYSLDFFHWNYHQNQLSWKALVTVVFNLFYTTDPLVILSMNGELPWHKLAWVQLFIHQIDPENMSYWVANAINLVLLKSIYLVILVQVVCTLSKIVKISHAQKSQYIRKVFYSKIVTFQKIYNCILINYTYFLFNLMKAVSNFYYKAYSNQEIYMINTHMLVSIYIGDLYLVFIKVTDENVVSPMYVVKTVAKYCKNKISYP